MACGPVKKRSEKTLALDLGLHLFLAVVLGVIFFKLTGGWKWPVLVFAGGVLIDLDHLWDHFLYFGNKGTLRDFFGHKYLCSGKVYILFHSWEIVILVALSGFFVPWAIPLSCGMAAHLLVDQFLSHSNEPFFYFFVYRAYRKFNLRELLPGRIPEEYLERNGV
ncbi:MAG: hypothetical protein GF408_06730 [Candidatus Omnitrophica bacterium]|nr:hypothetical protein [Candidatus Omnitrophota bacterium]